ncbi:MAG: hypothetical protein Q4G65_17160 [bacterium]|nr:hypothetical protein [bacterium]
MKRVWMLSLSVWVAGSAFCGNSIYIESLKKRYAFTQWGGATRTNYRHRVDSGWMIPDLVLPTNSLRNAKARIFRDGTGTRMLVFGGDDSFFRIDTEVYDTVMQAHCGIISKFDTMTTTKVFPQVTNGIGDVLFHESFRGSGDVAVFARNNVFVSINSYLESCSATNIAKQIDASILRASGINP